MNTKIIYTAITVVSLFVSTSVIAHDPSKHATPKKKPNCEAIHKMDSSKMDMNEPVMQAMKQCGKSDMKGHNDQQVEKPTCSEEHAKLGHCTLEAETSDNKQTQTSNDLPPVIDQYPRKKIGHDAPMDPSAPPHERADHRKVYEIPDCENMSNMHHSNMDAIDPVIQELMKKCEDADTEKREPLQGASKDSADDEHD